MWWTKKDTEDLEGLTFWKYHCNDFCFLSQIFILVPIGMLLASIYLVVAPITTDPTGSLIALGVVLAGLPFYWLFIGSDHAPKCIVNTAGVTTFLRLKNFKLSSWGCVSLRKSKVGFLNPKEFENGFCVSLLGEWIQDLSDHDASKEPKNPFWKWILWFVWCTMIWKILDSCV